MMDEKQKLVCNTVQRYTLKLYTRCEKKNYVWRNMLLRFSFQIIVHVVDTAKHKQKYRASRDLSGLGLTYQIMQKTT